jgi:hypothetical protein
MTDLQDSHNLLNQDLPGWDEGQQDAISTCRNIIRQAQELEHQVDEKDHSGQSPLLRSLTRCNVSLAKPFVDHHANISNLSI